MQLKCHFTVLIELAFFAFSGMEQLKEIHDYSSRGKDNFPLISLDDDSPATEPFDVESSFSSLLIFLVSSPLVLIQLLDSKTII